MRAALLASFIILCAADALADDVTTTEQGSTPPARPVPLFNRWQEDWSKLADPALRTKPLDNLKYIPLSPTDPSSYASFGFNFRERYESLNAPSFGVKGSLPSQSYIIQRTEVDADVHPNANWQFFTQIEDARAFGKTFLTPADEDRFDLEQAFAAYNAPLWGGELKIRVGRQEIGFDLERFISARDGPNVRQAYDAVWADWERQPWRIITFWSHPVQYLPFDPFDDYSNSHVQYGGFRVERDDIGPGKLSAYISRYDFDNAHFLFASGDERRNILDVRYTGQAGGFDWDAEAMGQRGNVGSKEVRAWAIGSLAGYTFGGIPWKPRFGLQFDAASGTSNPQSNVIGTFNPLFPNGYYLTLSGYEGYTNLIHLKPSITVEPADKLKVMAAVGARWRETTADAIYTIPDVPVAGTADEGGLWTGLYQQLRVDYAFNANLSGAVEAVHYDVGQAIRAAGGHDSDYLGVELKYAW
jgi:Alginate export